MKNLFDGLQTVGLSDTEARKSIEVVYQWLEEEYPVLAAVARATVMKEINHARADLAVTETGSILEISGF